MLTREELHALNRLATMDRTIVQVGGGWIGIYSALSLLITNTLAVMQARDALKAELLAYKHTAKNQECLEEEMEALRKVAQQAATALKAISVAIGDSHAEDLEPEIRACEPLADKALAALEKAGVTYE